MNPSEGGQGPYQVNVDVIKTATRKPEGLQRCSDVLLDLGCLAWNAGPGPNTHLFVEAMPYKFGSNELS